MRKRGIIVKKQKALAILLATAMVFGNAGSNVMVAYAQENVENSAAGESSGSGEDGGNENSSSQDSSGAGENGETGEAGGTGENGGNGEAGGTGENGEAGGSGETGETDGTGESGGTGETDGTGESGETGETDGSGENGETGETDGSGENGETGETDGSGENGEAGETDGTGESGETGETDGSGENGEAGETDGSGENGGAEEGGEAGDNGGSSETGEAGEDGEAAEPGENGESGNNSPSGETGGTVAPTENGQPGANGGAAGSNGLVEKPEIEVPEQQEADLCFEPVEIDGVTISVEILDARFDGDVTLSVEPVDNTEEIEKALLKELNKKGKSLETFGAYDIRMLNDEGEEVEPVSGALKVSFSSINEVLFLDGEEETVVEEGIFQVKDDCKLVDMKAEKNEETGDLEFTTTHFSVYANYTTKGIETKDSDYVNTHETKWAAEQPEFGVQSESVTQEIEVLEYGSKQKPRRVRDTFTISENADGDLYTFIELGQVLNDAFVMPGDNLAVELSLFNESGHIYRYKAGSYAIAPAEEEAVVEDTVAFNGLPVPEMSRGYRIVNKAIKVLFPGLSESDILDEMREGELERSLAALGYEGEGALSRYFLDYYKGDTGAEKLDDLETSKIAGIYPQILAYDPDQLETESELIELYFNYWNNVLFKVSYDGQRPVDSIGASMRNDGGLLDQADSSFSSMGIIDRYNGSSQEYKIGNPIRLELDGEKTTNVYGLTSFSYTLGFALEQVDHNLTINYFNLDNGSIMCEPYNEMIFIEQAYDVTETANKAFDGFNLVKMDGDSLVGTGDADKVINVYYSSQKDPVVPDSYKITINYYEKGTANKIADTVTTTQLENTNYNVLEKTRLVIAGYTWDSCDNSEVEGVLTEDLVFNVYYIKNSTTPDHSGGGGGGGNSGGGPGRDPGTVDGGPGASTTINEEQVPLAPLPDPAVVTIPEEEVPLVGLPKTGDTSGRRNAVMFWMSGILLAVSAFTRKREENDRD
ncbi:MAG: doubled motif LPXTG anchor domain-containing protein [Enterocloster asparagiformis]|nr:doubled motif LPXTG anchor domain-containing protein [Enterocloster asparagiformis]